MVRGTSVPSQWERLFLGFGGRVKWHEEVIRGDEFFVVGFQSRRKTKFAGNEERRGGRCLWGRLDWGEFRHWVDCPYADFGTWLYALTTTRSSFDGRREPHGGDERKMLNLYYSWGIVSPQEDYMFRQMQLQLRVLHPHLLSLTPSIFKTFCCRSSPCKCILSRRLWCRQGPLNIIRHRSQCFAYHNCLLNIFYNERKLNPSYLSSVQHSLFLQVGVRQVYASPWQSW